MAGRHIVVTGAGTGIGRAIALRLAADGARLTLVGRRAEPIAETAAAITGAAAAPLVAPCDLRDAAAVERAFDAAVAAHGPLHALVANAGIGGPNEPGAGDRFDDLVATNLVGTYASVRAAQARLAPGPGRRDIVITASILARIGVPGYTGYCASKAGLLGLVRALAAELAGDEVQVNAICPGWVDTEMARTGIAAMADGMGITFAEARARALTEVPLGRMSAPEDIAGTVAWLLSPDSRGVTGQAIDQNGGAWM